VVGDCVGFMILTVVTVEGMIFGYVISCRSSKISEEHWWTYFQSTQCLQLIKSYTWWVSFNFFAYWCKLLSLLEAHPMLFTHPVLGVKEVATQSFCGQSMK
jgi:hypothetical protein